MDKIKNFIYILLNINKTKKAKILKIKIEGI